MHEVLTADDAEVRQRRAAGALLAGGLGPGDRVAFVGPAGADALCGILGALRVGVVPVLLNSALLPAEVDALLADCRPGVVVGPGDAARLAGDEARPVELAPVPLARPMHYTSGTTGTPKGVWSGVLAEHEGAALVEEERALWGHDAADVHLVCGPLHHSAPVRFAQGALLAGGRVVLAADGRFDAAGHAAAIHEHRPTATFAAPAHLQRLLALPEPPPLTGFRLIAHAGAACPEPLKRRIHAAAAPGAVWEFYSSTEGQVTACSAAEWEERPGTVGRARPGRRIRIDEDGAIWCAVPRHARFEYWGDPAKTARAWRGDEFSVFDLGRLDDDGYLFLDGRRDDLIISGGVNVYPAEVERALEGLPGVEQVAVFPRADEAWGQRVCAAVVGSASADEVLDGARGVLAAYKRPKEVHVVPELPTTPTGKVRRSRLAEDLGLERPAR